MTRSCAAALGVALLIGLSSCVRSLVTAFPAPRDPVTSLDPLDPGETEISVGFVNTAMVEQAHAYVWPLDLTSGFDVPISASLAQGVGRAELRASVAPNPDGIMWSLGLGVRGPALGRWVPVLDAGYGYERVAGLIGPAGTAAQDMTPFSYTIRAPSVRLRGTWQPSERVQVPIALRYTRSRTVLIEGLEQSQMRSARYMDLSVGLIWDAGPGCLQWGTGLSVDPRSVELSGTGLVMLQASMSCQFSFADLGVQP